MKKKHDLHIDDSQRESLAQEAGIDGGGIASDDVAPALMERLDAAEKERDDLRDGLLRMRAEFDNFRRRVRHEQAQDRQRGIENFVTQLLPIVDNFERAMQAAENAHSFDSMADGVHLILRSISELLARNEIEPIPALGEQFDPSLHDALQSVATDEAPDHTIVTEIERGYRMGSRVIRPSKVVVAVRPVDAG